MQCTILSWLLGIWLVETVVARHILEEDNNGNVEKRVGRDQFTRRQPFYNHPPSPMLNYNSFRSSLRRTPPQVPGRRNLVEQEVSNDPYAVNNHYNNYFTNDHYRHHQNKQNLNVYSAVRLHGALETRAQAESGSNTLLPVTSQQPQFNNYFYSQDASSGNQPDRQWRRDDEQEDAESYERDGEDLARFSLYNSYFDNEHSIKALNSMKCVTPTGSPGFCSTFRGCVPSFFAADGQLEAPALAELISTSIGYCTTNVTHHFIREQRQHAQVSSSREERRFNSVANRIICCPGVPPEKDPAEDPDKIFNDYLENQEKMKTTTSTTTDVPSTVAAMIPEDPASVVVSSPDENTVNEPGESSPAEQEQQPDISPSIPEENVVNDGADSSIQDGSHPGSDAPPTAQQPVEDTEQVSSAPVTLIPEAELEVVEPVSVGESQSEQGVTVPPNNTEVESASNDQDEDLASADSPSSATTSHPTSNVENVESSQHAIEQEESSTQRPSAPVDEPVSSSPDSSSQQQPGKLPDKTQDSNIIKIYPDPVSGVNGKFTLPGGIYIVSTSTENTNQPKPVHPPGEQVNQSGQGGSKPIIIVTQPVGPPSVDHMPHFPSDFPPMGSQESQMPPVDDSSLELQRPSMITSSPQTTLASSPIPSTIVAGSTPELPQTTGSSSAVNTDEQQSSGVETTTSNFVPHAPIQTDDKVSMTTAQPQQDETLVSATTQSEVVSSSGGSNIQQDESDIPITTVRPQQPVSQDPVPSGDSSTNEPLSDDAEVASNDGVTIVPIQSAASENSGSSTQAPEVVSVDSIVTTAKPQPGDLEVGHQQQQGVDGITTISSAPVSPQDVEFTTTRQSVGSQEAVETTTTQVQITTLAAAEDTEDSEESSEEIRATPSGTDDVQKTTVSPDENNEVRVPTTTAPVVASNDEINQDEEQIPPGTTIPTVQQHVMDHDKPTSEGSMVHPGSEPVVPTSMYPSEATPSSSSPTIGQEKEHEVGMQQDEPEQASETSPPFLGSSPGTPGDAQSDKQHPFPGTESTPGQPSQQDAEPSITSRPVSDGQHPLPDGDSESEQEPFPGSETSDSPSTSHDSHQSTQMEGEQSYPVSEDSPSSESSQTTNVGDPAWIPTTTSTTHVGIQHDDASGGSQLPVDGEPTVRPSSEPSSGSGARPDTDGDSPVSGSESDSSGSESTGFPGSSPLPIGSESSSQGNESDASGTEPSISGSDSSSPSESPAQEPSPSDDGTDSNVPGNESLVSSSTPGTDSASSTSQSSSDQTDAKPENEYPGAHEQQPVSQDEPIPAADDSQFENEGLPVSSTTTATTTTGGSVPAENIAQDDPSEPPAEPASVPSPVHGSDREPDSPVSTGQMQDSQTGSETSDIPQDISSPAPVTTTSEASYQSSTIPPAVYPPSTAEPTEPPPAQESEEPNYQILKACKFQTYFRSLNDMDFSYRHYPWLATIVGGTRPFSSGTLITDRHILTASHFLSNITVSDVFNMRIHIGYRTAFSGATEGPYAVRKVRKVIRHKGFSFEKLYNDIAVLVLDRPVRFSEDIYPVCISSNRSAYADGTTEAFETGWIEDPRTYTISKHHNYIDPHIQKYFSFGYKNITWRLQEAEQKVRTNLECQSNYNFLQKNGILVTDSMVCAGSGDSRSCAFRGNSGAPLFLRSDDSKMTEQVGIVSWGIGCYLDSVFTRVESFLPWLDRVVYNSR